MLEHSFHHVDEVHGARTLLDYHLEVPQPVRDLAELFHDHLLAYRCSLVLSNIPLPLIYIAYDALRLLCDDIAIAVDSDLILLLAID